MAGKGDKERPMNITRKEYGDNWDNIFKKDIMKRGDKKMKSVERPNLEQKNELSENDIPFKIFEDGYNNCLDDVVPYIEHLEKQLEQINRMKIMPCSC